MHERNAHNFPLDLAAVESTLRLCKLPPSAKAEVSRVSFG